MGTGLLFDLPRSTDFHRHASFSINFNVPVRVVHHKYYGERVYPWPLACSDCNSPTINPPPASPLYAGCSRIEESFLTVVIQPSNYFISSLYRCCISKISICAWTQPNYVRANITNHIRLLPKSRDSASLPSRFSSSFERIFDLVFSLRIRAKYFRRDIAVCFKENTCRTAAFVGQTEVFIDNSAQRHRYVPESQTKLSTG